MGGYTTSSRIDFRAVPPTGDTFRGESTSPLWNGIWKEHGPVFTSTGFGPTMALPTQVTTSYRTGRSAPLPTDGSEVLNNEPSTLAGEFGFLKNISDADFALSSSKWDNGHTFRSISYGTELSHPYLFLSNSNGSLTYVGPIIPWDTVSNGSQWITDLTGYSTSQVNVAGGKAVALTAPTRANASLGPALGELVIDGLPKLALESFHTVEGFLTALARGHLSVQFDWAPFISDLRSVITALLNASRILRQYQRDSGREVRRAFHFPLETTTMFNQTSSSSPSLWIAGQAQGAANGQLIRSTANSRATRIDLREQKVYFKGAYTYYLPPNKAFWDKISWFESQANHLLGLELNPALLWELTPWSWLIDWKLHIGRFLQYHSQFHTDGLVLRYGYLMVQTTRKNTISLSEYDCCIQGNWTTVKGIHVSYYTVLKQRFRAGPYGFGIDSASFTDKQWSILAALGMTRAPKKLRNDD